MRRSAAGMLTLAIVAASGCEQPDGTRDFGALYFVLAMVGVFLAVRAVVRWNFRQAAKRDALLRSGISASATLVSFSVIASAPHGKVPSTGLSLLVEFDGGAGTTRVKMRESVPTFQMGRIQPEMTLWVRFPTGKPKDAIIDWSRSLQ